MTTEGLRRDTNCSKASAAVGNSQARLSRKLQILATSGRALAQLAVACGYRVLVADNYTDRETQQIASAWVKIPPTANADHWQQTVEQLLKPETSPVGLVFGSGFEHRPHLIGKLSPRGILLGNTSQCIRLIKDPRYFFPLLDKLGIPAPQTQLILPKNPLGWLRKEIGGTGGYHVLPADLSTEDRSYYQRKLAGEPGSVLFLANGKRVQILGYHRLWIAATPTVPYRYGGIAAPLDLPLATATLLQNYLQAIVSATGLRGLNGLDFIQTPQGIQILEINPRPPASVDLYQDIPHLFDAHIQACQGAPLPLIAIPAMPARAFAIFYAPHRLRIPLNMVWPAFCRDQPIADTLIEKEEPVCSVHATGANIHECQQLIIHRQRQTWALISPDKFPSYVA